MSDAGLRSKAAQPQQNSWLGFLIRDMRTWPGGQGLVILSQIAGTADIEIRPGRVFGYDFKCGNKAGYQRLTPANAVLFFT